MNERPAKLKRVCVKEELVALTGDFFQALILGQFIYWSERTDDVDAFLAEERLRNPDSEVELTHGWIYKSTKQLHEELMFGKSMSAATVGRRLDELIEVGWIDRRNNPKHKWDRCYQYRPNVVKIQLDLQAIGYALEGYPLLIQDVPFCTVQNADCTEQNRSHAGAEALPEITAETTKQIGATPVENPNPGNSKPTKTRTVLNEQAADELMLFGIQGEVARNNIPKENDALQAGRDIDAVWGREIKDDTRAAIIALLVAIRTVSPDYPAPNTKDDQGAWGRGAVDDLKIYSLAELRQLYPAAVKYNLEHNLNYFRPQSLTQTLQRIKHGNFNTNGNGASAVNPLTPTGSVRIG